MYTSPLNIRLFGEFSIKSPYYEFRTSASNSSQLTLLISYLVVNQGNEVSKEKLMEVLWPDENIKNYTGSLRNLIYRARKELKKLFPDEDREYILFTHNSYLWNPNISCHVDVLEFERLNREAKSELNDESRYKLLSDMHALYQGEFLPAFTSIEWVLYENIYYRNLYIDCTLNMCSFLYKRKRYDDIIALCDQSCLMYQEEERFHRYKLMAYLGLDLPSAALDYYRSTVNFFSQKFGIDINPTLNDIYQEILSRLPSMRLDINSLEEDLKEEQDSNHTFYCNFDIFRNFYQLNRRSVRRSHSKHYLLLLTLDSLDGYPMDVETTKEEMQILYQLLSTQLRKNDIFTRSSHSQYSVILTVPNEYGSEVAERRILQKYDQVKQHDNMGLNMERKLME